MIRIRALLAACIMAAAALGGCGSEGSSEAEDASSREADTAAATTAEPAKTTKAKTVVPPQEAGSAMFKAAGEYNNPLMTNNFCADPTAIEYNGRLYVYGTNDEQQYQKKGDEENTYEKIKSIVILSTDDMANWRYEGLIDTGKIAKWITASWAPSIVSRTEDDGKTHFYLYFSNSGVGVGVLTATDPAGPWEDPLKKPLIYAGMKGLGHCPIPFDPGVVIDDKGVGWLTFGGGEGGSDQHPKVSRIVRLGKDMISLDSDIVEIDAPYFFEASELNFIGGKYVYTFNTSWKQRSEWDYDNANPPPTCSMCYMTSTDPLDPKSWEYRNYYFLNPGDYGMEWGNNHTHLQKFQGKYYLFYHAQILYKARGLKHAFRSLCVNEMTVDEENAVIEQGLGTRKGVVQIKALDPYTEHQAEEVYLTDCTFTEEDGRIFVKGGEGNVIGVRKADFGSGSSKAALRLRGSGKVELFAGSPEGEAAAVFECGSAELTEVTADAVLSGESDIYFVTHGDIELDSWIFSK